MKLIDIITLAESAPDVTNSEAFQRWFAGSKVVNPDGTPKRMYHGTAASTDFKAFKVHPRGIFFTEDPSVASSYADEKGDNRVYDHYTGNYEKVGRARVMPVYLRVVNPYVMTPEDDAENRAADGRGFQALRRYQTILFDKIRRGGHDGVFYGGSWAVFDPKQIKSVFNTTFNPDSPKMSESA